MKTTVDVWANTRYIYIQIGSPKGNAWESAMYIIVLQVQTEYLVGKPPLNAKNVEQPGGHHHEVSIGQLRPI